MVMIQVVHHYNMVVDRSENKGEVIQADQVVNGNGLPGQVGSVVIGGDADMNNNSGRK
jgi:hypothetical protein